LSARSQAHHLILDHARRAGIRHEAPEMRRFARELFLLCRQCGAAGLAKESAELFALARQASGPAGGAARDFQLYSLLTRLFGWTAMGKLFCELDRLRPK
jgi:hypothetical protein